MLEVPDYASASEVARRCGRKPQTITYRINRFFQKGWTSKTQLFSDDGKINVALFDELSKRLEHKHTKPKKFIQPPMEKYNVKPRLPEIIIRLHGLKVDF